MRNRGFQQDTIFASMPFVGRVFTRHALERMAQRNLTHEDIRFVMQHGQRHHRTGVLFFFLGRGDLPMNDLLKHSRLEGTTVLVDPKSRKVITTYRDKKGLGEIKRKTKY